MKKYFIQLEGKSVGPFSLEDLKILKITASTPVWIDGEKNWKKANEIKELQSLFFGTTQGYTKPQSNYNKPKSRSTNFENFSFETDAPPRRPKVLLFYAIAGIAIVAGAMFFSIRVKNEKAGMENEIEEVENRGAMITTIADSIRMADSIAGIDNQENVPSSSQDLVGSFDNNAGAVITITGNSDQHLTVTINFDFKKGADCKGEISGDGKRVEDEEVLVETFQGCELTLDYNGSSSITVKESKKCKSMHGMGCSLDGEYMKSGVGD